MASSRVPPAFSPSRATSVGKGIFPSPGPYHLALRAISKAFKRSCNELQTQQTAAALRSKRICTCSIGSLRYVQCCRSTHPSMASMGVNALLLPIPGASSEPMIGRKILKMAIASAAHPRALHPYGLGIKPTDSLGLPPRQAFRERRCLSRRLVWMSPLRCSWPDHSAPTNANEQISPSTMSAIQPGAGQYPAPAPTRTGAWPSGCWRVRAGAVGHLQRHAG